MARFLNPSLPTPFVGNLFGIDTTINRRGGFKVTGTNDQGVFGPGALSSIGNFLSLQGPNAFTSALGNIGRTGDFGGLPPELLAPYQQAAGTLDDLIGTSRPVVQSLIETGNPVDVSALVQKRFSQDIIPEIAEQFNPASGTGFQNIAAREAANLITELEVPAEEAARARQLEALTVAAPTLAGLSTSRLGLPAAAMEQLALLGETSDPGARLFQALMQIIGSTNQPSEFVRQGTPPSSGGSSTTGNVLGVVGDLLGSLCWVADELFGVDDIRTALARTWCQSHPEDPFVQQYAREGEGWAAWLRENQWAKPLVAPAWEILAQRGAAMLAEAD